MNSNRHENARRSAAGNAVTGLGWIVVVGLTSSCSADGGADAEAVAKAEAAIQGPMAASITATGGWRRPMTVNYTVFDYGSLLACAVPGGSTGPGNITCGDTLCPTNTFTFGCDATAKRCIQSTSNSVTCWNRNGVQHDMPALSSHIQSVMIGKLGTQARAVAALTEDGVVHWSTGNASDTLATFHAGFNTWSDVILPIDDAGNSVCLKKIVAISIPNQLGIESHMLGLSCSNKLLVHAMSPAGAWSPAEVSLPPWTLLPANVSWQDISHYNPQVSGWTGAATLLSTTGQVWRVGRAQFSATGVRTFDPPTQLPALSAGRVATAVGGTYVLTDGSDNLRIAYNDDLSNGWQWFEGGQPTAGPMDVAKIIVDAGGYRPSGGGRDFAVYQLNQRLYAWQDPRFESGVITSADWNTTADWDSGFLKGTCSSGYAVNGFSRDPSGGAHKVICRSPGPSDVPATAQYITGLAVPGDARRATRTVNNGQSDWAPGSYKLECGANEFVSGVSQSPSSSHDFHGIRCSGPSGFSDTLCFTKTLGAFDDRFTKASNDWDAGFVKAECGINSYVAGVSVSPGTGRANSILCCSRTSGIIF